MSPLLEPVLDCVGATSWDIFTMPPVGPVVVVPDPVVNVLPFALALAFWAKIPASEEVSRRSAPVDPVPVVDVVVPMAPVPVVVPVLVPVVVPVALVVICVPVRFKVNGLGLGITPGGNFGPTPGSPGRGGFGATPVVVVVEFRVVFGNEFGFATGFRLMPVTAVSVAPVDVVPVFPLARITPPAEVPVATRSPARDTAFAPPRLGSPAPATASKPPWLLLPARTTGSLLNGSFRTRFTRPFVEFALMVPPMTNELARSPKAVVKAAKNAWSDEVGSEP